MTVLDLETIAADRAARVGYWRARGVYSDMTFADALRAADTAFGDVEVVFHSQIRPARATVGETYQATERLAAGLHRLGLASGDRIAVVLPTWYDAVLCYMAALKLGLVVVPVVAIYGARELGFILRQTRARAVVVPDEWRGQDYVARVAGAGDLPDLKDIIVVGGRRSGTVAWDALLEAGAADYPRGQGRADDVCCIIYTSGATAEPKGVQHTHNTQLCDLKATHAGLLPAPVDDGPVLSVFPAGHIASYMSMLRPYLFGGGMVFMDQWTPAEAARLVQAHRVVATSGTPIFLLGLREAAEAVGADISSLKRFGLGGSAVTPENVRLTDQLGFPSGRIYGMTEQPVVSTWAGEGFERRAYTDGRPAPFNEVRIVDEAGADVVPGEVGEVCTRGPKLFVGYLDAELDRAAFLPGGWYRSGDIGRVDEAGYLTITDRKKDIIIRGGENISSKEVEDVLSAAPGVVESAVTAMPDPLLGERICAFVILKPDASLALETVRAHFAQAGIARQKTPERIIIVSDFPRTPSGKIKKFELRERLRSEAAHGPPVEAGR